MSGADFDLARTIPANPGFFVMQTLSDDNGYPAEFYKNPVVAWAFGVDCLVPCPVTLDGVAAGDAFILEPGGSVERPNIDGFPSVDAWLKSQQLDYLEKQGVTE